MIIVFDSGVGGFSILREIARQKVLSDIIYLADQINFPYGNKTDQWLSGRLQQIAGWASTLSPQAFVLACNTATVSAIVDMRRVIACPVIGVEPVIKPLTSYSRALVLATAVTARSARTHELMKLHGGNISIETPEGLGEAIEFNDSERVKSILGVISEKVLREKIPAIGLSCTHYPLISAELQRLLPRVHIYDPAPAVVMQLKKYLIPPVSSPVQTIRFLTTGPVVRLNEQVKQYLKLEVAAEHVTI